MYAALISLMLRDTESVIKHEDETRRNKHLNCDDILSSYYAKCHFDVFIKTYYSIVGEKKESNYKNAQ